MKNSRSLNNVTFKAGPIIYWLSREQRVRDNWALLQAQEYALDRQVPLAVAFTLAPHFLGATLRQYDFMLRGLAQTAASLVQHNIPFFLLKGDPGTTLLAFLAEVEAGALVTDFDPLRLKRQWKNQVLARVQIPVVEVDAHNIVPCWLASGKQEFGAYTLRPKIHRLLPDFLDEPPPLEKHPFPWPGTAPAIDWSQTLAWVAPDPRVPPVSWLQPGEDAARKMLQAFIRDGLSRYADDRNDPNLQGQSNLSPYLHFGQLGAQRVAWEVQGANAPAAAKQAFLEELIVRRELSDNFCYYNPDYDSFAGFPEWARKTLDQHRPDPREYLYSLAEFEKARTHDALWNAAQQEMVRRGKMHGYLRMYWAKKILEWTASPEEALKIALYLNDRYELDGRDPNGYVGVAWSLGGVHDRAWGERPVFGKIRYMSLSGCKRKFKVDQYIAWVEGLGQQES